MTITLTLKPEELDALTGQAHAQGVAVETLVHDLIMRFTSEAAAQVPESDPTLALFARWDAEDADMAPEEVEAARQEFDEFARTVNAERARAGARLVY